MSTFLNNWLTLRAMSAPGGSTPPGPSPLPTGYTKVDWIASDGTAYINSLVSMKEEMALGITVKCSAVSGALVIGYANGNTYKAYLGGSGTFPGRICACYHSSSYFSSATNTKDIKAEALYQWKNGSQKFTVKKDGSAIHTGTNSGSDSNYRGTCLIAQQKDAKVYESRVYSDYDATILLFNGEACLDPNGNPGLFDHVSHTFFSNAAAAGAFTYGNDE